MADMRKKLRKQAPAPRHVRGGTETHGSGRGDEGRQCPHHGSNIRSQEQEYVQAAADAQLAARKIQAKNFVQLAESAESFANCARLANYQKAVEYQGRGATVLPSRAPDGSKRIIALRSNIFVRPSRWRRRIWSSLALGELYADLGLKVNAQGQSGRVLSLDKGNEKAKAALKAL